MTCKDLKEEAVAHIKAAIMVSNKLYSLHFTKSICFLMEVFIYNFEVVKTDNFCGAGKSGKR